MRLRWKHALEAYVLVLAGVTLGFVIAMMFEPCMTCGPGAIRFWPVVFLVGLACSLPAFLLFRAVLHDVDDYVTVAIGGAGLGAVAGVILVALLDVWSMWLAGFIFGGAGAIAGLAQLWLERWFDRRWPL